MMDSRQRRAENHYRADMRKALTELLLIMNPGDQISYPSRYEDLVDYAFDWLSTERQDLKAPPVAQSQGLSLDDEG